VDLAVLGGVLAFYLAIVVVQASRKLLWVDELITLAIARQDGLVGIWKALAAGADPNPLLTHIAVMLAARWFGVSALAVRRPSIVFVGIALVAMWTMLRRWVAPAFAAAGLLAFMGTRGFDYAHDARSYAPMMGLGMASLALWMVSDGLRGWRYWVATGGMVVALAAGISANYYCVLALFPIAAGELVRSVRRRELRVGLWAGMAVASLPLLAYLPLIRHNIAEFGPHAWNRPRVSMVGMSYLELVEGILWPGVAMAGFVWWKRRGAAWGLRASEATSLWVLLAYPILGFAIAVGGAGMISPRWWCRFAAGSGWRQVCWGSECSGGAVV
jgi:hypothetical protein